MQADIQIRWDSWPKHHTSPVTWWWWLCILYFCSTISVFVFLYLYLICVNANRYPGRVRFLTQASFLYLYFCICILYFCTTISILVFLYLYFICVNASRYPDKVTFLTQASSVPRYLVVTKTRFKDICLAQSFSCDIVVDKKVLDNNFWICCRRFVALEFSLKTHHLHLQGHFLEHRWTQLADVDKDPGTGRWGDLLAQLAPILLVYWKCSTSSKAIGTLIIWGKVTKEGFSKAAAAEIDC